MDLDKTEQITTHNRSRCHGNTFEFELGKTMKKNLSIACVAIISMLCLSMPIHAADPGKIPPSLLKSAEKYMECFRNKDFDCTASLTLPRIIEQAGGIQEYIKVMIMADDFLKSQGFDCSQMAFHSPAQAIKQGAEYFAIVPTEMPVTINGIKGSLAASLIGISNDDGLTWFFVEGNDDAKPLLTEKAPGVLQWLEIPTPTLRLGNLVLIQKNGQWVKLQ